MKAEISVEMKPSMRAGPRLSKNSLWEIWVTVNGYQLRTVGVFTETDAKYGCEVIREAIGHSK